MWSLYKKRWCMFPKAHHSFNQGKYMVQNWHPTQPSQKNKIIDSVNEIRICMIHIHVGGIFPF
jgi:hypothetical protein